MDFFFFNSHPVKELLFILGTFSLGSVGTFRFTGVTRFLCLVEQRHLLLSLGVEKIEWSKS